MQAPRSPVGQAWHPALRRRRTSPGQRRGEDIPRKSAPNVCSQWRDGRKMEDRSFKAYLMSDPQHTARGGGLGPPVSLSGSLCLRTCSVCLSAVVPAGSMSYIFCLGRGCVPCRSPFVRHLSSSPLTWNHDAPQQVECNKITVGAAVTWKLHTTSTHTESNETPLVWTPLRPGFGQETLTY